MFFVLLVFLFTLVAKILPSVALYFSEGTRFQYAISDAMQGVVDTMQFSLPPQLIAAFAISLMLTVFFRIFKLNA